MAPFLTGCDIQNGDTHVAVFDDVLSDAAIRLLETGTDTSRVAPEKCGGGGNGEVRGSRTEQSTFAAAPLRRTTFAWIMREG